jgi:hypothetical protein
MVPSTHSSIHGPNKSCTMIVLIDGSWRVDDVANSIGPVSVRVGARRTGCDRRPRSRRARCVRRSNPAHAEQGDLHGLVNRRCPGVASPSSSRCLGGSAKPSTASVASWRARAGGLMARLSLGPVCTRAPRGREDANLAWPSNIELAPAPETADRGAWPFELLLSPSS